MSYRINDIRSVFHMIVTDVKTTQKSVISTFTNEREDMRRPLFGQFVLEWKIKPAQGKSTNINLVSFGAENFFYLHHFSSSTFQILLCLWNLKAEENIY